MADEREDMIVIRDAYKRYSSNNVILRGLDMSVKAGTIYGLLGPSGCGKTTLLGVVSGRGRLDAGSVTVRLASKRQLGYMPQDIALVELFTVAEMFQYFGKVNGLSPETVVERGTRLLRLMELAPERFLTRVIVSLSGGQQRRVSLTVALLHDPLLLILDEPTVGLDPLISQKLWRFFVDGTERDGKTIIITTHYIEEARQAHTIGLMRNGKLLAEAPPLTLIEDYNCEALEDVFLLLSQKQSAIEDEREYPKTVDVKSSFEEGAFWDANRMKAQIYKNTQWAKKNVPMMLFMLALPAVMILLFCVVFSDILHGVNIAVVNGEVLPDSCLRPMDPASPVPPCKPQSRISCQYVELIRDKFYTMVEYPDFDSGLEAVLHGEAKALLHFQPKYSWSLIRRLSDNVITPDRYVNASLLTVYLDRAEITLAYKIDKDIRDSFLDLVKFVFRQCRYNIRAAEFVINFQDPIYGERSPKFTHTGLPGFIIPAMFYFSAFVSAASIKSEKQSGFLERCLIAGVRHPEIMIAHAVTQVLIFTGQNVMLFLIAYRVYDMPLKGSWSLVLVFLVLAELQGMFYGFFVGTMFDQEQTVMFSTVGVVVCMFVSCGWFWPVEGAHWFIHMLLERFPVVMAVESYRSVTIRGWGLSHPYIVWSIFANIGFAMALLGMFILATRTLK